MKKEQAQLIEVEYKIDEKKNEKRAVLQFLNPEEEVIREVSLNTRKYKDGEYIVDEEKEQWVEQVCQDVFGVGFLELEDKIGTECDVYVYDKYCSIVEFDEVEKFTEDMDGKMIKAVVSDVIDDDIGIHIRYKYQNKLYQSNYNWSKYVEEHKKFYPIPLKVQKQKERFKKTFHIDFDDRSKLIGQEIYVVVTKAFDKYYGKIQPMPEE